MSDVIPVPAGGFASLKGAGLPFSNGVIALDGFALTRVRLRQAMPVAEGLAFAASYLEKRGRPAAAFAAAEVRSPAAVTPAAFATFNAGYAGLLRANGFAPPDAWPAGRSNMAPLYNPPAPNILFAFTFATPAEGSGPRDYLISGMPEITYDPPGMIAPGDVSPAGMKAKAAHVIDHLRGRVDALGGNWSDITGAQAYTIHPLESVLDLIGASGIATAGLALFPGYPPVIGSDFEIDVRNISQELFV
jgi:hypothetical protein